MQAQSADQALTRLLEEHGMATGDPSPHVGEGAIPAAPSDLIAVGSEPDAPDATGHVGEQSEDGG